MKTKYFLLTFLSYCLLSHSQTTLAIQDFEVTPTTPTWSFTGTPNYVSGVSGSNNAPANSPLGIANSRSWETNAVGTGQMLEFNNITIPAGYEQIVFTFKLAAMDLTGFNTSSHGPDDLDYVLVEYSNDNGATYYRRLRIRGAIYDNSFWAFDASGVAIVDYLPTIEALFQPTNTGLATTYGYSTVGLKFPGATNQVKIRITARSSSISDSWLVDNVRLLGVNTPSAPIATSQIFCNSGTVANLVATGETDSTFYWYNVATGGTALAPTTILSTGTYYVSQTLYGLVSSRTSVSVVVGTPPTVDAGPATVTFCANAITPITATATTTSNGFQGAYAPANWTFANNNADGNANTTNAPASITLTGGNNGSNGSGNTIYSMSFATNTTISFNWVNITPSTDDPNFDYPVVLINGTPTIFQGYVALENAPKTQSGTMTVNVPAGQTFAFMMHTVDNFGGAANVTISNLVITNSDATYSWAATNGGTITGATNTASMTPATSGTYTVTATNTAGCTASDSVAVTINPLTTPTFDAITPFCSGSTAPALSATSVNGITGTWSPTTVNNTTSGTYAFTPTAGQCASTTTLNVTVNPLPTVDTGPATVTYCANAITPITATAATTTPVTSNGFQGAYAPANWTFANNNADGNVNSTNAPTSITITGGNNSSNNTGDSSYSITFATATTVSFNWVNNTNINDHSTYDYPQVIINGTPTLFEGYIATTTAPRTQSGTMTVNVLAGQTFGFNMHTVDNSYGAANVTISNLVITNSDVSYSWTATNGGTITGTTNTASMTPATSGTYTVTATNTAGCTATDSVAVTINTITATTSQTNILCFGMSSGSATVTASGGTPAYTFSWSPSGGNAATATGLAAGNYTCTITDANGCQITKNFTITQPAAALSATTSQTNILCFGMSSGSATVTPSGGVASYAYSWSPGGATTATITGKSAGSYTCTITDANGCQITKNFTITQPAAVAAPTGTAAQTFCTGETVSQIVVTGTGITWYTAATGGTVVTGSTALVSGTTYYASQTVNGCESPTRFAVTASSGACLGTDDFDISKFSFYPNPTSNVLNIEYSKNIESISVMNLLGQILFENKTNNTSVQVDLSNLPTATYFVKVKADGNEKTIKVVKQ